mgnify:CR=1 FL=1
MLYSELQCSEAIHKAVERMGFAEMTEIQEKTIPVMLAGRDVIAKAPTGTGKTCAFGIPVAEHIDPEKKYPQAVIMAPTRELAQQIAEELTNLTYFMPECRWPACTAVPTWKSRPGVWQRAARSWWPPRAA